MIQITWSDDDLDRLPTDEHWALLQFTTILYCLHESNASNHLSIGQISLFGRPLLRQPLRREHAKPRLLGDWGTTPGGT